MKTNAEPAGGCQVVQDESVPSSKLPFHKIGRKEKLSRSILHGYNF